MIFLYLELDKQNNSINKVMEILQQRRHDHLDHLPHDRQRPARQVHSYTGIQNWVSENRPFIILKKN